MNMISEYSSITKCLPTKFITSMWKRRESSIQ